MDNKPEFHQSGLNVMNILRKARSQKEVLNSLEYFALNNVNSRERENWHIYNEFFGKTGEEAIDLVRGKKISVFSSEYSEVYKVITDNVYTVTLRPRWCCCSEFESLTLQEGNLTCTHLLACMIAKIHGFAMKVPTTTEHVADIFSHLNI